MDSYRKQYAVKIHTTDIKDTYGGGHCTIRHGYLFCREDTLARMGIAPRLYSIVSGCYLSDEVVAESGSRCDDILRWGDVAHSILS